MVFETTQLLIGIVLLLTLLVTFIGIQVFITLRDARKTFAKANRVLDESEEILEDVALPIRNLSATFHSLQTTGKVVEFLFGTRKGRKLTKNVSSYGRQLFERVEGTVDEFESEEREVEGSLVASDFKKDDRIERIEPSSFLSFGRRFFKGTPKKR